MTHQTPMLSAHFLPEMVAAEDLANSEVVAVDILRATSTIVHALGNGALAIRVCLEIDEARDLANTLRATSDRPILLGGERGGKRIEGFDLGSSPEEYSSQRVAGKTIVLTTTNGTRAIRHARYAKRILAGAFSNLSATCGELRDSNRVDVLCAGTGNQITREDVLFAGAVIAELSRDRGVKFNDQAELAVDAWKNLERDIKAGVPLAEILRSSLGARNLLEIGMERDIEIAARIDAYDLAAEVDRTAWEIHRLAYNPR